MNVQPILQVKATTIPVTELKQLPGSVNCYAVAAAMAINISVEEVESELLPSIAPYSDIEIYKLMLNNGYYVGCIIEIKEENRKVLEPTDNIGFYCQLKNQEAFLVVESETKPKPNTHTLYWDGKQIYDPNPLTENGRPLNSYKVINVLPINKL